MSTDDAHFIPHPFQDTDHLLRVLVDNDGEIVDVGLSEDPIVWRASELGLVDIALGDGWTMRDTVRLTARSRVKMGLPPIIKKPTMAAIGLRAALVAVGKLFGASRPQT